MTLEDFERQLAADKAKLERPERDQEHSTHRHRHHQHRSHREGERSHEGHRHKRRRRDSEDHERRHSRHRPKSSSTEYSQVQHPDPDLKRDAWMETPSAGDVDYIQRRRNPPLEDATAPGPHSDIKVHEKELNRAIKHAASDLSTFEPEHESDPSGGEVDYVFGDKASQWRMTKLRGVYREAEASDRDIDEVALERYGSLREFDAAREEEIALDRRNIYGKDYVGKEKPTGDLYQARMLELDKGRPGESGSDRALDQHARAVPSPASAPLKVGQTELNKMRAQLMKAKLRGDPSLDALQQAYDAGLAASTASDPSTVTLSAMDSRMLASAPRNEVKSVQNRRGAARGHVEENEDMSIEDMVREERRTRGQRGGESKHVAERIAKDAKFDNDLEYMDDNATKLAKRVHMSANSLRNVAINDYQKLNKALENCPLCHQEDTSTPPIAPVVSLATRTYLTLPTEPELVSYGALIVPIQHHTNLIEADDDEWEEMRNFMKSLTRFYHDRNQEVIFYENAAHPHRKPHAALVAVPLAPAQAETAPAFFKEAFLTTEGEWSQHKKIIDTLSKSKQGLGKLAFRRTLVKEMPYFHVWFEMDGGLGHVVEDPDKWPRGDLFAREVIGGVLGLEPDLIKRQGRWQRGHDARVEKFRRRWNRFDWTRILVEGG